MSGGFWLFDCWTYDSAWLHLINKGKFAEAMIRFSGPWGKSSDGYSIVGVLWGSVGLPVRMIPSWFLNDRLHSSELLIECYFMLRSC